MIRTSRLAAGLFGLTASLVAHAQTAPAYRSEPLDVMNYQKFLYAPKTAYDLDQDLNWQILDRVADAFLTQDFEARIFVVGPAVQGGDSLPRAWTSVGDCQLYLSLVFPIAAQAVRASHELHVTSLDNDVRWLTVLSGRGAPTKYIVVFERRSQDDGPGQPDFDRLGRRYEFISLDARKMKDYFARGLVFEVEPPFERGALPAPYEAMRQSEVQFFVDAADHVRWRLHCYHASPTFAQAGAIEVAQLSSACPKEAGEATPPDRGG